MSRSDLMTWAARGAAARVREIEAELAELRRAFPDALTSAGTFAGSRRRKPMSVAHRLKVSSHMKRYWQRWREARARATVPPPDVENVPK